MPDTPGKRRPTSNAGRVPNSRRRGANGGARGVCQAVWGSISSRPENQPRATTREAQSNHMRGVTTRLAALRFAEPACQARCHRVGRLRAAGSRLSTRLNRTMLNSIRATGGMAVSPHALAAQSALAVLRERGNALEAMIAAAATIPVVVPAHELDRRRRVLADPRARAAGARDRRLRRCRARGVARLVRRAWHRRVDSVPRRGGGQHGRGHDLRVGSGLRAQPRARRPPAAYATACRCDRICRPRHRGHRQPGGEHGGKATRARIAARFCGDLSARRRCTRCRTDLPAAAPGRDAATSGRPRAGRLLPGRARPSHCS